jgi:hypothetical protein
MTLLQRPLRKLTRGLTILCVFGAGSALAQQAHTLLGVN